MKRKLICAMLCIGILLSSCTTESPGQNSPTQSAAESEVLTGVYTAAAEIPREAVENHVTPILPVPADDETDITEFRWVSWDDSAGMQIITRAGDAEIAVNVEKNTQTFCAAVGQNGVYSIEKLGGEGAPYRLYHYDFNGNAVKVTDLSKLRPSQDKLFAYWPNLNNHLPILETDGGYLLVWENTVITMDSDFRNPVFRTHPSEITGLFRDDTDGRIWISYEDRGSVLCAVDNGSILRIPDAPTTEYRSVIGIRNGEIYCKNNKGIHRYPAGSEEAEMVMSFENSSLNQIPYCAVPVSVGDRIDFSLLFADGSTFAMYCMPGEDISLDGITVLELAVNGQYPNLLLNVYAFNASQKEYRIIVNDYSRFNTPDNINGGLNRFRLDLETGILTPDLIFMNALEYTDIALSSPDMLLDLYTIDYSDAEYTPYDLWPAVRHAGEANGKLYAIIPLFELSGLVGLKEYTSDLAGWDLQTCLDYADSLPEGKYLLDSYGKKNSSLLFGRTGDWNWLPFYEQGSFDDPLYVRYLNFISRLPETGPAIQEKRSSNIDNLILSGEYNNADITFAAGGANMYRNGTILLSSSTISSVYNLIRLTDTLGADSAEELCFVGYPSGRGRGLEVHDYASSIFSILSRCKHPEAAWKFMEFFLKESAAESMENPFRARIPALREPALELLRSLEGRRVFYDYVNDFIFDDPDSVKRAETRPEPGKFYTIDSSVTGLFTDLLDSELLKISDRILMDLRNLLTEEELSMKNGGQSVEATAKAVQSRTAIYIAEHE